MLKIKKNETYANIRKQFGKLSAKQVEGFEAIFDYSGLLVIKDKRWLAYILATIWHETAFTMQPVAELGKGKNKPYGKRVPGSDKIYYGRGLVQVTWRDNYEKLSERNLSGWDFIKDPDLLLQMIPSVWAAIHGMTTGLYTGKELIDFFNNTVNDPVGARRIINGSDRAELVASYHTKFLNALVFYQNEFV